MRIRATLSLVSVLAVGCGGARVPAPEEPPAPQPEALIASPPRLAEGVALLEAICAEGAEERCDALDQDCDGRIDEGCEGASDAPLVAALAWNGTADVDLVLDGPAAPARDARGCDGPRLERASIAQPEPGTYRVEVVHADACGDAAPVTVSVSLAVNGVAHGPFNRSLAPGERAPLFEIDLSRQ